MTRSGKRQGEPGALPGVRKRLLLGAWCALAVGVLAGCGGATSSTGAASDVSSTGAASDAPTTTSASGSSASSAPAGHEQMIMIENFEYTTPASVSPGATVEVMNIDGTAHTVTADDGGFDANAPAGGTVTFTAPTTPGTYAFHCTYHSNMHGILIVK